MPSGADRWPSRRSSKSSAPRTKREIKALKKSCAQGKGHGGDGGRGALLVNAKKVGSLCSEERGGLTLLRDSA